MVGYVTGFVIAYGITGRNQKGKGKIWFALVLDRDRHTH